MSRREMAPVSGVVLAAGGSRRFGGELTKQLLAFRGKPLVRGAVEVALAADLAEVIVVVGNQGAEVRRALQDLPVVVIENLRWSEGQSFSVRRGLAEVSSASDGALFMPCDQPLLTPEVLDSLVAAHRRSARPIVVPTFRGEGRSPVLFGRSLFPKLASLTGDEGGRQILRRSQDQALFVAMPNEEPFLDVDRPDDFERLLEHRENRGGGALDRGAVSPGALPAGLRFSRGEDP